MAVIREAQVVWEGDLLSGSGSVSSRTSGTFADLPVSWRSRTESPMQRTSPEELLGAAHASCFVMALSNVLAQRGNPPQRLEATARVTFDRVDGKWKVASSSIEVSGLVPGIDAAGFREAAENAKNNCPISQALKGNVALSVNASLKS